MQLSSQSEGGEGRGASEHLLTLQAVCTLQSVWGGPAGETESWRKYGRQCRGVDPSRLASEKRRKADVGECSGLENVGIRGKIRRKD